LPSIFTLISRGVVPAALVKLAVFHVNSTTLGIVAFAAAHSADLVQI
jgi:hypothetical protein